MALPQNKGSHTKDNDPSTKNKIWPLESRIITKDKI
jgi:hypothetical protein